MDRMLCVQVVVKSVQQDAASVVCLMIPAKHNVCNDACVKVYVKAAVLIVVCMLLGNLVVPNVLTRCRNCVCTGCVYYLPYSDHEPYPYHGI